jgi:hypothetical protein
MKTILLQLFRIICPDFLVVWVVMVSKWYTSAMHVITGKNLATFSPHDNNTAKNRIIITVWRVQLRGVQP